MWFYSGCDDYLMNVMKTDSSYILKLTNFVLFWENEFSAILLTTKFKDENPTFEGPDKAILSKVEALFSSGIPGIKRECKESDSGIILKTIVRKTFSYGLTLSLALSDSAKLYQELTINMLGLLKCLENREKKLVEIIEKKDEELEEYRLEGVEIKRRGVATEPFNYKSFDETQSLPIDGGIKNPATFLGDNLIGKLSAVAVAVKEESKECTPGHMIDKKAPVERKKGRNMDIVGCKYVNYDSDTSNEETCVGQKKKKVRTKQFVFKV